MYELVSNLIDHVYSSSYSGDQQYIYTCCCILIPILTVIIYDLIRDIISAVGRGR